MLIDRVVRSDVLRCIRETEDTWRHARCHTIVRRSYHQCVLTACNFHMHALLHIRCSISKAIANTIACSVVGSGFDYCNVLLFDAPVKTVSCVQCVLNNLARTVFNISISKLHDSCHRTSDLLRELHWLPVQSRIVYKVALLCYKHYKLGSPTLLQQYTPS